MIPFVEELTRLLQEAHVPELQDMPHRNRTAMYVWILNENYF